MKNNKLNKLNKINVREMRDGEFDYFNQHPVKSCAPDEDGLFWRRTLLGAPDAASECPWEKLDSYDWVSLLYRHPQFAEKCDLLSLDSLHLVHLLSKYPQWITQFDLNKMDGAFCRIWHWRLQKLQTAYRGKMPGGFLTI